MKPAWIITHDVINVGEYADESEVGRASLTCDSKLSGGIPFRLLDDDGEHYFTGRCNALAIERDDSTGGLYEALRWAMGSYGCTDLRMKVKDAKLFGLFRGDAADDEWVSIYG